MAPLEWESLPARGVCRSDEQALGFLAIGGVFVVLTVFSVVRLFQDSSPTGLLPFVAFPAIIAAINLRVAFGGVIYDEHGIRIRNPRRTITVLWQDIESFAFERGGLSYGGCVVHLRDGGKVRSLPLSVEAVAQSGPLCAGARVAGLCFVRAGALGLGLAEPVAAGLLRRRNRRGGSAAGAADR